MVCMEAFHQLGSAKVAMSSGFPSKNAPLPLVELAAHLLTQYSVRTISRIGKFAGGFSIACSLTRFTAAVVARVGFGGSDADPLARFADVGFLGSFPLDRELCGAERDRWNVDRWPRASQRGCAHGAVFARTTRTG